MKMTRDFLKLALNPLPHPPPFRLTDVSKPKRSIAEMGEGWVGVKPR